MPSKQSQVRVQEGRAPHDSHRTKQVSSAGHPAWDMGKLRPWEACPALGGAACRLQAGVAEPFHSEHACEQGGRCKHGGRAQGWDCNFQTSVPTRAWSGAAAQAAHPRGGVKRACPPVPPEPSSSISAQRAG